LVKLQIRKLDESYDKINKKGKNLSVIFNRSLDMEGDVEYDKVD